MQHVNLRIEPVDTNSVFLLTEIGKTTFLETFAPHNHPANMEMYVAEKFTAEKILEEIACSESWFFIAYEGEKPLGYIKLHMGNEPGALKGTAKAIEIERLYVFKAFHKTGIGASLMAHGIQFARSQQAAIIWLGVWEHNNQALDFYRRWGFEVFGAHVFMLGNDPQHDLLMHKKLDDPQTAQEALAEKSKPALVS